MNYDKTITFNPPHSKKIDKLRPQRFWIKLTNYEVISEVILELRSIAIIPPYLAHLEDAQNLRNNAIKYLLMTRTGVFPYSSINYLNSVNFPLPVYNLEEAKIIISTNNTN